MRGAYAVCKLCLLLKYAYVLGASSLWAQPAPFVTPLQARLSTSLDSRISSAGTLVSAVALLDWHGPDCLLKSGSALSGHVVKAQPFRAGQKEASLVILFDKADCNKGANSPVSLVLFAVVSRSDDPTYRPLEYSAAGVLNTIGPHDGTTPLVGLVSTPTGITTRFSAQSAINFSSASTQMRPRSVKAGQVFGFGKLKLSPGTSSFGASLLHMQQRDFTVPAGTQIVLVSFRPTTPKETLTPR